MFDKFLNEQWNVFTPFAKGWQDDRNDVQPIIKIFAECSVFHHLFQVGTGCRDDANVHFDRAVSADPLKFPFLKDTQKLDLEGNRHVSDFIQEDSSTVCLLESTDAGLNCTGESSFYMAEKLGLQQVLGNCATVDTYELLVFSRAV